MNSKKCSERRMVSSAFVKRPILSTAFKIGEATPDQPSEIQTMSQLTGFVEISQAREDLVKNSPIFTIIVVSPCFPTCFSRRPV